MARRRKDINTGASMVLFVVAGIVGLLTGSFWAFLGVAVILYFILRAMRILR
jgi:hypothetical protein